MIRRLALAALAMSQVAWAQYFTSTGVPVRWYATEVAVITDENGTSDVDGNGEFDAILASMETWNAVSCPHPKLIDGGTISGAVPGDSGPNLLIWEDASQWTHVEYPKVIALTTLYYNDSTGRIAKYDMEFADYKFQFTVSDDPGLTEVDVQNTVTHELGHVLGLDHSSVLDATMYYKTDDEEPFRMRTLEADDIEGLCSIYNSFPNLPDGQSLPDGYVWPDSGPWTPPDSQGDGSCSVASVGSGGAVALVVLFWLLVALLRRRRAVGVVTSGVLVLVAVLSSAVPEARAVPDLDIRIRARAMEGRDRPAIIIGSRTMVKGLVIRLKEGGRLLKVFRASRIPAGRTKEFEIAQPPGEREYTAEIVFAGREAPEIITFKAVVARPMKLSVSRDTVDLAEGRIAFVATEAVGKVKLEILGDGGGLLLDEEFDVHTPAGGRTEIRFDPPQRAVVMMKLTAYDRWGFYNGVEIRPFFVEIPHEEVLFEFGRADIRPSEEPKLKKTMGDVHEALARLGNEFRARLYVAGYTDTVGTRDYNRKLSYDRARSIARWFKGHGIDCGVCFQGFGEEALEVATPDETPEPRNRRTLHVLANQHPPPSKDFPSRDWTCL